MGEHDDERSTDLRIAVLAEQSAAMRGQSQAELIYTAAAMGSFGALALGVAAAPAEERTTAGLIAGVTIIAIGLAVAEAIRHNHAVYMRITRDREQLARDINALPWANGILPAHWIGKAKATGYLRSLAVLTMSMLGAALFCLHHQSS